MIKKLLPILFLTATAYSMQNQIDDQNRLADQVSIHRARQIHRSFNYSISRNNPFADNSIANNRIIQAEYVLALIALRQIKSFISTQNQEAKTEVQSTINHIVRVKNILDRHVLHQMAQHANPPAPVIAAQRRLRERFEDAADTPYGKELG